MKPFSCWIALITFITTTLALDAPPSAKTCPRVSNTAGAGGLPAERSTVTSTVTVTRTPDLVIGGASTGSCAAASGQGGAASTITITKTRTYTSTSTKTAYESVTDSMPPVQTSDLPAAMHTPASSDVPAKPTSLHASSSGQPDSSAQNHSMAIVTAYFSDGGLPSIGPLQNYTLPAGDSAQHSPASQGTTKSSTASAPSNSPHSSSLSAISPTGSSISIPASAVSPPPSGSSPEPTGSGSNPPAHASGDKKPCQITVYTYAETSNCMKTFNDVGACGFSTYFPQLVGNGMSRLAIPAEIFDSFGGVAQNNPVCGRTVTITAANGVSRQVMVADRNADPTFDLCMDIWTDFGYTSGGGRFDAHWSLDPI